MTKNKTKGPMTATTLRIVLASLLLLILAGMSTGFYFAYTYLKSTATAVASTQAEALASDAKLQQLMSLQGQLDKHKSSVDKAKQIVAESQMYQYQNQIIGDLNNFANQAGLAIKSFIFQSTGPTGATPQPAAPPVAPAAGAAPGGTPAAGASGVKSTIVSIQLDEDISYENLLHFIYLTEQNLTRMQVSGVTIAKAEDAGKINAQNLNLEVYIK